MLKFVRDKISFISGICLILLSFLLFYEASTLSPFGSVFPYAITTALLILSVILIFRSFKLEIKVINEKVSFIKIPFLPSSSLLFSNRVGESRLCISAYPNRMVITNTQANTKPLITLVWS